MYFAGSYYIVAQCFYLLITTPTCSGISSSPSSGSYALIQNKYYSNTSSTWKASTNYSVYFIFHK